MKKINHFFFGIITIMIVLLTSNIVHAAEIAPNPNVESKNETEIQVVIPSINEQVISGKILDFNSKYNFIKVESNEKEYIVKIFNGTELLNADTAQTMQRYQIKNGDTIFFEYSGNDSETSVVAKIILIKPQDSKNNLNPYIYTINNAIQTENFVFITCNNMKLALPIHSFKESWSDKTVDISKILSGSKIITWHNDTVEKEINLEKAFLIKYNNLQETLTINGENASVSYILNNQEYKTKIPKIKIIDDVEYVQLKGLIQGLGPNYSIGWSSAIGNYAQRNSATFAFINNSSGVVSTVSGILNNSKEVVRIVDGEMYIPVSYVTSVLGISTVKVATPNPEITSDVIHIKVH